MITQLRNSLHVIFAGIEFRCMCLQPVRKTQKFHAGSLLVILISHSPLLCFWSNYIQNITCLVTQVH